MPLIQVGPSTWRLVKEPPPDRRGRFPTPHHIQDSMPPCEQVDGNVYTSKSAFRRVGREHGMVEIGDQTVIPTHKKKIHDAKQDRHKRREAIQKAVYRFKNGERPRTP